MNFLIYIAIFCGSCMNSSVKIWDARSNNSNRVLQFDHHIPNTHGIKTILLVFQYSYYYIYQRIIYY